MSSRKQTTPQTKSQENNLFLPKSVLIKTRAVLSKRNYESLTNTNPFKDKSQDQNISHEESLNMKKRDQDKKHQKFEESKESKNLSSNSLPEKILPREFYTIDPVTLARNLLGKIFVRKVDKQVIKCKIVETEAYGGIEDKGCHAYGDKFTDKTKYLYQEGGHLCVSFIYGISYCLSITADVEGQPAVVLIRAVEVLEGLDHVIFNRDMKNPSVLGKELANGPGKVCVAMRIYLSHNTHDVTQGNGIYLIEGDGQLFEIVVSKRINIDYAEEYKDMPWRFYIKDNINVSCKGTIVEIITPIGFTKPTDGQHSPRTTSFLESLNKFRASSTQSARSRK